jgi:hypothetical protein
MLIINLRTYPAKELCNIWRGIKKANMRAKDREKNPLQPP